MVRSFLAVEVAPEIHAALVELKQELSTAGAAVRWVRDAGLHATVKFLGGVPEAQLPVLHDALTAAVGGMAPPRASVRGLGMFPNPKRPRVVWVGLDCQPLTQIAAAVDAALAPLGFARETRPYHAHITLGRVKELRGWAPLDAALQAHRSDDFGSCTLGELIGYRSDLRRDGAVYTKLWTIPFGG
jgi:RNA 2',3'-cyclic 3'-phosphodiesterase